MNRALAARPPSPDLTELSLQCAAQLGKEKVQEVLMRSDVGVLVKVFNQAKDDLIKVACFRRIRHFIERTSNYKLLEGLSWYRLENAYFEFKKWVDEHPHPELYYYLAKSGARSGVPMIDRIALIKEGVECFPGSPAIMSISLEDFSQVYASSAKSVGHFWFWQLAKTMI